MNGRSEPVSALEKLARDFIGKLQGAGGNGRHAEHPVSETHGEGQGRDIEKISIPDAFSSERLKPKKIEAMLFKTGKACIGPPKYGCVYYERDSVEFFAVGEDLPVYWKAVDADPQLVNEVIIGRGKLRRSG